MTANILYTCDLCGETSSELDRWRLGVHRICQTGQPAWHIIYHSHSRHGAEESSYNFAPYHICRSCVTQALGAALEEKLAEKEKHD